LSFFQKYKPIRLEIMDEDKMAIDDKLGEVLVDWMDCFDNPSKLI